VQAPGINERMRKRLVLLLADDRLESDRLMQALLDLRGEGCTACAAALHLLAHVNLPEKQAERLLRDLLSHRADVTRALGRDPGIRVAAVDYLSNVKRLLVNPTIVERSDLERTERSAMTDPLTRLFNRRYFTDAIGVEVRRSRRHGLRMALLMLDLDRFKVLNDLHGHLFGDRILQRVGRVLRRSVRDADVPCRYGGEEFAIILPETDRLGGYAVAERIRVRIDKGLAEPSASTSRVRLSLSGGVAAYPEDGSEPPALISRADQALYLAKRRGKNRISLFHSERRQAVRYPARPTVRAGVVLGRGRKVEARPINLSASGALLWLDEELEPAMAVELAFAGSDATGRSRNWTVSGRVIRVEPCSGPGHLSRVAVAFAAHMSDDCLFQQVLRRRHLRAAQGGPA